MAETKLRVNWTIPAPILIAIFAQAVVFIWYGSAWKTSIESTIAVLDTRIGAVERNATNSTLIVERVKGVEVNIEGLKSQNQRIETKLDSALERRK